MGAALRILESQSNRCSRNTIIRCYWQAIAINREGALNRARRGAARKAYPAMHDPFTPRRLMLETLLRSSRVTAIASGMGFVRVRPTPRTASPAALLYPSRSSRHGSVKRQLLHFLGPERGGAWSSHNSGCFIR